MITSDLSICIVAGAGGLIGSKVAEDLAGEYDHVYSLDKTFKKNKNVSNKVNMKVDLTLENDVAQSIENIFKDRDSENMIIKKLVLINCQAIADPHTGELHKLTLSKWNKYINTNLTSYFLTCREVLRHRKKYESLRIVNISSTRHLMAEPNTEAYGASKGAILSFTRSLAVSLKNTDSLANCISPGWIDEENVEHSDKNKDQHLSGRVGKPSDISRLCSFLCGDGGDFISGQDFVVDGGVTAKMIYK